MRVAALRRHRCYLTQDRMRFYRCVMDTAKYKDAHICLSKLGKACRHKAAIAFIWRGRVKEIARLYKEIDTLSYSKISCLLKGMAQSLLAFFTLARRLAKGVVAKMVIRGEYHGNDSIRTLLLLGRRGLCRDLLYSILCHRLRGSFVMFYSISSSLSQIIPIKNYPVDKKEYLGDSKAAACG